MISQVPKSYGGEQPSPLPASFLLLEQAVRHWLSTYAGWDRRKHPTILQFLHDTQQHVEDIGNGSKGAVRVLQLELDRLGRKIPDPYVNMCIKEFLYDIDRLPNSKLPSDNKG